MKFGGEPEGDKWRPTIEFEWPQEKACVVYRADMLVDSEKEIIELGLAISSTIAKPPTRSAFDRNGKADLI